jgi:hypothetical protein
VTSRSPPIEAAAVAAAMIVVMYRQRGEEAEVALRYWHLAPSGDGAGDHFPSTLP